jgi:2-polyprenyl-3-methyl-5-hydroxy-6-metoxy-1,4-benzoquinol methylase
MANATGKHIDKTHLSIDTAEERGFIHRDYIAHCNRWTHVVKYVGQSLRYKTTRILDFGCGKEVPLAKTLYSSKMSPEKYTGVDVNKLEVPEMLKKQDKFEVKLISDDICNVTPEILGYKANVVTSFEVIEHVEPEHCIRILKHIKSLMSDDGIFFLSTPCFDEHIGAAGNHVNEITYDALYAVLKTLGFSINKTFGTFASQKDYIETLEEIYGQGGKKMFDDLRSFFDSNMLSTILAPLFPSKSRNCLWELGINKDHILSSSEIDKLEGRLSSSDKWEDFKNMELYK